MSLIFWFGHGNQNVSKIKIYQIRNLMFLCIVAFVEEGLPTHMDQKNTEGSNLKPYLNRF
jgi:hypothetical protein